MGVREGDVVMAELGRVDRWVGSVGFMMDNDDVG